MVAVGLVEGLAQVNWRKVWLIVAWWLLGPFPLIAAACFIYWQGVPAMPAMQVMPAVQTRVPLLLPRLASSTARDVCFDNWDFLALAAA